jgi:hypothetical protein
VHNRSNSYSRLCVRARLEEHALLREQLVQAFYGSIGARRSGCVVLGHNEAQCRPAAQCSAALCLRCRCAAQRLAAEPRTRHRAAPHRTCSSKQWFALSAHHVQRVLDPAHPDSNAFTALSCGCVGGTRTCVNWLLPSRADLLACLNCSLVPSAGVFQWLGCVNICPTGKAGPTRLGLP